MTNRSRDNLDNINILANFEIFQGGQKKQPALEQLDQKSGTTGLEPVIAVDTTLVNEQQDVERVVDQFPRKVVVVVPAFQLILFSMMLYRLQMPISKGACGSVMMWNQSGWSIV